MQKSIQEIVEEPELYMILNWLINGTNHTAEQ